VTYPRQLARMRLRVRDKTCFVLMPFDREFDDVYAEIKECMAELGFDCKRADDIFVSRSILETVIMEIKQSQLIIADLTTRNANVFYELGIAHILKDLPSVILVSQNVERLPFDISHNLVLQYNPRNLKGLRVRLRKSVVENQAFLDGRVRLVDRYHYLSPSDEFDRVVEFLDSHDRSLWQLIIAAFKLDERIELGDDAIAARFGEFVEALNEIFVSGNIALFRPLHQIFIDLSVQLFSVPAIRDVVHAALRTGIFERLRVDVHTMLSSMTDLALAGYRHPELKRDAIHWILEYLRRPKTGGIDLNRAKAETFVLTTARIDPDMRDALLGALADKHHLKEVAADALGELALHEAVPSLIVALGREDENPYVARSIFSALGKIGDARGGPAILEWLQEHSSWSAPMTDDVRRYAERALIRIDTLNGTSYRAEVDRAMAPVKPARTGRNRQPRKSRKSG
jgi:HEAT repeats